MIDPSELARRAVKYLVEGLMVALAAYAIPKKSFYKTVAHYLGRSFIKMKKH